MPQRPRPGDEFELTIDRLAYGGKGVGRLVDADGNPGMVAFVAQSAPGDRVRARLQRVRRRHAEAYVVEILERGHDRVEPACPHYDEGCGGCSWQHLDYAAQVAAKEAMVRDSLVRIGGIEEPPVAPILSATDAWYYRNKMEFSFHARDGLGLHAGGDWRRVVPVSECRLESELAMRIVDTVRGFGAEYGLSSWDPPAGEGFLRQLVIRHARGTGETMVALVTSPGELPPADYFADSVAALDPSIVSILHATRAISDGARIESIRTLRGRDTITERIGGLSFTIGLQTFFQTNSAQAERMLEVVRQQVSAGVEAAGDGPTSLLDVFCGVGFFTLGLADLVQEAAGVEIVAPSIVTARENAELNGIDNAHFYAGDARRTLPEILERHGTPTVVLLDPPRDGAGGKVMRRIARAAPGRIVYVSCNPTTLARDLRELGEFGYEVTAVQPIDLFPQTYHVETVVTADRLADSPGAADAAAPDA